ncbi:hypothetical protein [Haloactinospora alba]|uniref:hypothetical protein n=1 Tax=Haloactinospora alba TaxID=405555 RepID=UPI001B87E380|nr:hypothetical protein [Haloactinospora alba]
MDLTPEQAASAVERHECPNCAAIIDRLTFAGNILETGTTSYRLAHARSATAH